MGATLKPTESQIQSAYFDWVRLKRLSDSRYNYIIKVPNETRGNYGWLMKLKKEGLSKGVPDIICFHPTPTFRGMALETKRPGGKLTAEQREWLDRFSRIGWLAQVGYSTQQLIAITEAYMDFGSGHENKAA